MMVSQLGHFKVWYAGVVQNWPLANYELGRSGRRSPTRSAFTPIRANQTCRRCRTPTDDLDDAIKAKDIVKFHKAYARLTAACNACHEATGFGFIKIREPRLSPIETSPFTDESFSGK